MVLILSIGLLSIYGCSAALSAQTPAAQPTVAAPVAQPTLETLAAPPVVAALVTTPAPVTVTAVIPSVTVAPIIPPTTAVVVATPTPTPNMSDAVVKKAALTAAQESFLADIRAKAEQPSPGIYYVDAATMKKMVDTMPTVILDARYKVDWDKLHIIGSLSLPVSSVWIQTTHPEQYIDPATVVPDKDTVIIAYCAPGCPAGLELAAELSVRGYHNLFVLIGGYLAWQDAGYGMVKQ